MKKSIEKATSVGAKKVGNISKGSESGVIMVNRKNKLGDKVYLVIYPDDTFDRGTKGDLPKLRSGWKVVSSSGSKKPTASEIMKKYEMLKQNKEGDSLDSLGVWLSTKYNMKDNEVIKIISKLAEKQ